MLRLARKYLFFLRYEHLQTRYEFLETENNRLEVTLEKERTDLKNDFAREINLVQTNFSRTKDLVKNFDVEVN